MNPGTDQAASLRALREVRVERSAAVVESSTTAPLLQPPPPAYSRARVIAIASGKGGVGKTNLAVNLAVASAQAGRRVILVDADLGLANADVLCGLNPARRLDPAAFEPRASGQAPSLADWLVDAPGGWRLLPASAGLVAMADLPPAHRARLVKGLDELATLADLLIIDSAAGVGRTVLSLAEAADLCIIVVTPEPTSIADGYATLKALHLAAGSGGGGAGVGLVVNQARDRAEATRTHARINAVAERFLGESVPLLGWFAQDAAVGAAVRARVPLLLHRPTSRMARSIRQLAAELNPAEVFTPIGRASMGLAGLWRSITGR